MLSLKVSVAEALDKFSILYLKKQYIKDENKLIEINKEYESMMEDVKPYIDQKEYQELLEINDIIWKLTDEIREKPSFDKYKLIFDKNDIRYRIKNNINSKYTSTFKEQKNFIKPYNYICQGKLGDLVHCLYGIFLVYETEGVKGNLYITDKDHKFSRNLHDTFTELVPVLEKLPYLNSFSILNDDIQGIDLAKFRSSPKLYKSNWCNIISSLVNKPEIPKPWINLNVKENNLILVHRSISQETSFPWENLLKKNRCFFITCNDNEYKNFKYKHLLSPIICNNLKELFEMIAGCKYFIGNQSSPLAVACAMHKPYLAELFHNMDAIHYINENKNNKNFNWFLMKYSNDNINEICIDPPVVANTGNGVCDTVLNYFPKNFTGTCVDVGACLAIWGSNSFYFEKTNWRTLCIEPIPSHCDDLRKYRKNVIQCACGAENKMANFEVVYLHNQFQQGAISSLKVDERLIESHKHLYDRRETIQVQVRTLNSILEEYGIEKVDFISIDTENTELDVLKGFDLVKYKPYLMVIENNFNEPYIEEYLKPFGYIKTERQHVNDFYKLN